jgi:hypothetical protein
MNEKEVQKYIKQVRDEANKDIERYIGSAAEDVKSQVSAVAELVLTNTQKLDTHTEMIGSMKEDI